MNTIIKIYPHWKMEPTVKEIVARIDWIEDIKRTVYDQCVLDMNETKKRDFYFGRFD